MFENTDLKSCIPVQSKPIFCQFQTADINNVTADFFRKGQETFNSTLFITYNVQLLQSSDYTAVKGKGSFPLQAAIPALQDPQRVQCVHQGMVSVYIGHSQPI